MKKIIVLSTAFLLMASAGFAQKPAPKAKSNPVEDTIQYSLGVYMMQQLFAKTGFVVNDQARFKKAIDDVLNNRKLEVNPATTQDRLLAYQRTYQLQRNRQLEAALFEKAKSEKGFTQLASGVMYTVAKAGTAKDTIVVNVICTLPDGTVVDDYNKTRSSYMALAGEMIPGLRDVLFRVEQGTIFRAILPAATAYGEQGTSNIPPNSAVIYDIALINVKPGK
jgi:FKBP-type peptidyl-prolyl cis-trans isomerase FklB